MNQFSDQCEATNVRRTFADQLLGGAANDFLYHNTDISGSQTVGDGDEDILKGDAGSDEGWMGNNYSPPDGDLESGVETKNGDS